ncbi:MAG TPA: hypothetical protein VMG40_15075 [Bryobacteraceae bacterium]|nr:hypothetical protein [Bryobacteraceae bacterium]
MLGAIRIDFTNLKRARRQDYAIRFLSGGVITMSAGFIAKHGGSSQGGLFLAFPAILPAAATLIAKHECEEKTRKGLQGEKRGRIAAALDTRGAALGSAAMLAFAAVAWWSLPRLSPAAAVLTPTAIWAMVAVGAWVLRKKLGCGGRRRM